MVLSRGISKISITYLLFISRVGPAVNVGAEQNPWLALAAFRSAACTDKKAMGCLLIPFITCAPCKLRQQRNAPELNEAEQFSALKGFSSKLRAAFPFTLIKKVGVGDFGAYL